MRTLLTPNEKHNSLIDIDFEYLRTFKYIILDVDNTLLTPWEDSVKPEIVTFLWGIRSVYEFADICLISNVGISTKKRKRRLEKIAKQLKAHFVQATGWHAKPHSHVFRKALTLMGADPEETIMIGDQIFTDIRGGNKLGMYTILLKPMGKDRWITRYRRWRERHLFR